MEIGVRFQSTLPRRERLLIMLLSNGIVPFQSTLPRRERRHHAYYSSYYNIISIHAPTKGATLSRHNKGLIINHFNPRSHEGSDKDIYLLKRLYKISIHAPTKGATSNVSDMIEQGHISIHAPTKGATKDQLDVAFSSQISIHAPTKGATLIMLLSNGIVPFQSTLPRRERHL